ncbi:dihydrolipoyllysine-residue acetyltransferase [Psychromonas sp. 14N.309.X.WAT.B.A12]|uniref:dihydrolipoyllysine-residue acetyltransferase n=1 Tax=Psychromonas sp. 14N.309.X.WAT.B.A12 TaxID=2998322 RepID=UPI0025B2449E|nr:dihydrolipoyllysine-residue acetyltransferase [Psychromonas sp. 14N.309.X.WAT.B.A12]MDN2662924.1 dihydrolipoyllysine-residue acetyltransferase [Psychromonas sp. 14N.309.X.WAT.B.A12]
MSELKEFLLPDIGADAADITDILVAVGDTIAEDQDVLTIEGDKASMDVPSSVAGVVKEIKVNVGDSVSEGNLVLIVEVAGSAAAEAPAAEEAPAAAPAEAAAPAAATAVKELCVPDIGGDEVEVTDILVAVGDTITEDQDVITVEGDKASMDVPAPFGGVVKEIKIATGDKVSEGSLILLVEAEGEAPAAAPSAPAEAPKAAAPAKAEVAVNKEIKASPSVRRIAREFDLDLNVIAASGPKGRTTKEDVQKYVKGQLQAAKSGGAGGLAVAAAPKVDFAKFGEVEVKELSRIQKISGPALHRNWVTIPHVTQFDEADITELEEFRKEQNAIALKQDLGVKISPLVFMMKAVAKALQQYPNFNSSLSEDGQSLILKKYFNIGIAVDTPNGLVVPVVKDVLNKGIFEICRDIAEISKKARAGKLTAKDMQGGSMTISSLGGIGGTQFTPIVNAPEVAILGVSKSAIKPQWNGKEFEPRMMVPLALSYDHRVIDGADGARFITAVNKHLSDLRTLIL